MNALYSFFTGTVNTTDKKSPSNDIDPDPIYFDNFFKQPEQLKTPNETSEESDMIKIKESGKRFEDRFNEIQSQTDEKMQKVIKEYSDFIKSPTL